MPELNKMPPLPPVGWRVPIGGALPLPLPMPDGTFCIVSIPRMRTETFELLKSQLEIYRASIVLEPPSKVEVIPPDDDQPETTDA